MVGRNFSLIEFLSDFVDWQVVFGWYQNVSEVVCEVLCCYEGEVECENFDLVIIQKVVEMGLDVIVCGDFMFIKGEMDVFEFVVWLIECSWING